MLILAQLPEPSAVQSAGWLCLAAFGLAGGINQVMKIVDRVKGKPSAAEVQTDTANKYQPLGDYATQDDLDRLQEEIQEDRRLAQASRERIDIEIKGVQRDLSAMERRLNESGEKRAKETHDRINLVLEAVAELRGEVHAR